MEARIQPTSIFTLRMEGLTASACEIRDALFQSCAVRLCIFNVAERLDLLLRSNYPDKQKTAKYRQTFDPGAGEGRLAPAMAQVVDGLSLISSTSNDSQTRVNRTSFGFSGQLRCAGGLILLTPGSDGNSWRPSNRQIRAGF